MNQAELDTIVRAVVSRLNAEKAPAQAEMGEGNVPDISEINLREQYLVDNPHDRDAFLMMKSRTPARVGIGHVGARYKTATQLRFLADHAAAQAAVFSDVNPDFLAQTGWPVFQTKCQSKDEYLTRPDLGRVFEEEVLSQIRAHVGSKKQVVLCVADGLSSKAVEANGADIVPVIQKGLENAGVTVCDPFFVRFGRVGCEDAIGSAVGADVVCLLVGERPGLVTAESMSAYIAYRPTIGMAESRRTVLSNIHRGGTPSVEAGAHAVELIQLMLEKKVSGIELPI